MEIQELIDLYQKKREEREKTLLDFLNKKKNFIIRQPLPGSIWGECNTIETIYDNNIKFFENMLRFDWTDDLPFLEPWIVEQFFLPCPSHETLERLEDVLLTDTTELLVICQNPVVVRQRIRVDRFDETVDVSLGMLQSVNPSTVSGRPALSDLDLL